MGGGICWRLVDEEVWVYIRGGVESIGTVGAFGGDAHLQS